MLYEGKDLSKFRTPCFIFSKKKIINNYQFLKKEFGKFIKTEVAYSFKTNNSIGIAKILLNQGSSLMLCSLEELYAAIKIIKNPLKIIFLDPALTKEEFKKALNLGVRRFVIDCEGQLKLVIKSMETIKNIKIDLLIRINTGIDSVNEKKRHEERKSEEQKYNSDLFLGIEIKQALKVILKISKLKFVNSLGIHHHYLTQNTNLGIWGKNMKKLAELVWELEKNKIKIKFLDIGGGIPVDYKENSNSDGSNIPKPEQIIQIIKKYLSNLKVDLIIEPGRFIVAPAGILLTKVLHTKLINNSNVAIVNSSVYNSSMDSIIINLNLPCITNSSEKKERQIIRGKTPCSLDIFRRNVLMPKLKQGDLVAFLNAGAYTFASDFLNLKKPEVKVI